MIYDVFNRDQISGATGDATTPVKYVATETNAEQYKAEPRVGDPVGRRFDKSRPLVRGLDQHSRCAHRSTPAVLLMCAGCHAPRAELCVTGSNACPCCA